MAVAADFIIAEVDGAVGYGELLWEEIITNCLDILLNVDQSYMLEYAICACYNYKKRTPYLVISVVTP